jgi:hypothetical protein
MRINYIQLPLLLLLGPLVHASGQTSADAGWSRLKALPAHTRVHVSGDKQSKVCAIDLVDEATLQCSRGNSQYSFARAEVKSVKLTRYTRSTLVGMGIGLGVGAGVGAIAGHTQEKPNDFFPGLTTAAFAAVGGAGGLVIGGAIGGPTDFLRGPTVYRRP